MQMMTQILDAALEYVHKHWIEFLTAAVFMGIGWYLGKRRARSEWRRKEFLHRLNVSLNMISDGRLLIRTIMEKSCADVFLNTVAAETVAAVARKTTESDPILPLPKSEYWYYLNAVLNEVSEKFATGQIRRDLGVPVNTGTFLICLTCECAGEVKTRKVRAMLIKKMTLEKLPEKRPMLESPNHATRWETLKLLAETYSKHSHKFLEVEINV